MKHTPGPLTYEMDTYSGDNWLVAIVEFGRQPDGSIVHAYITTDGVQASRLEFGDPEADLRLWTAASAMYESLDRAVQLAGIASDWDLGTDGKVEIDGEWVSCWSLRQEFAAALAAARGEGSREPTMGRKGRRQPARHCQGAQMARGNRSPATPGGARLPGSAGGIPGQQSAARGQD